MMNPVSPTIQEIWHEPNAQRPIAVLCSGGLDSAVMLGEALVLFPKIYPLYIRTGLSWEQVEMDFLQRFLAAVKTSALAPLTILDQPIADVYGAHWSITGNDVPDENSPDSAVYLPGRNILLLSKAAIWCHLHQVPEIAMAPLAANPFPDATPEFFGAFCGALSIALKCHIRVIRPYAQLNKAQVILRGRAMPLQHTFSCISPIQGLHCGHCNKCAERQNAFREAEIEDPTVYEIL